MRAIDGNTASNISATTAAFQLDGGKYGVDCKASNYGTVKLQRLAADGSTYVSPATATDFAADGYATVDLPRGQYRWTVATATAVHARVTRTPGE